jgi:phospholipid/cholesterol/gamma-HCH transport system ATP-binding protein
VHRIEDPGEERERHHEEVLEGRQLVEFLRPDAGDDAHRSQHAAADEREGEREPKVLREKVREILDVVELEGQEEKMPVSLSGGMKKRVGLARSIIRRPKCVLYDEPTSGLDPVVSDSINRLIRRLQERFGMTSIVVTHDMKSAFDVADHIAYLHEGRIYFYGTPIQLQQTSDPILQDFLLGRSAEERGNKVES